MKSKQSSLWVANEVLRKKSNLYNFCKILNKKKLYKKNENFNDLWKWSVRKPEVFWSEVWNFTKIKGIKGKKIIKKNKIFYKNNFFPDSKLNYAENLLSKRNGEIALNFFSESGIEKNWIKGERKSCSICP